MESYDIVVIGTGEAGTTTAQRLTAKGKKVAIVDGRHYGGTCALRGCDPKKVLIAAARIVALSEQLQQRGIAAPAQISWPELMASKRNFTESVPANREKSFQKAGIATFHGHASFIDDHRLQVGESVLTAPHFIIATGAKPRKLGIPGEELLIDSSDFLELKALPKEIILVGGGYIAFEFAHLAARMGSKVTIIHRGTLPLEHFEPDMVKLLLKASEAAGITIWLQTEVQSLAREGEKYRVEASQNGKTLSLTASLVVHAAGRTPDVEALGLDKAGIEFSEKGVTVNQYLQSVSNPSVYACGDAANSGPALTPVAVMEAHIVTSNLLNGNHKTTDYSVVPSNVFTIPALASVGLTEPEARERGFSVKVKQEETTGWFSSKQINEPVSGFKVIVDSNTDKILGAHLLGHHADEVINLFALAMKHDISASDVRRMMFAYPTNASDLVYMV